MATTGELEKSTENEFILSDDIKRMKQKKNFNEIDDYTVFEVFRHLDNRSLLNCTEVCRKWKEIINEHPHSMATVWLKLTGETFKSQQHAISDISRRYPSMRIQYVHFDDDSMIENLTSAAMHVKTLKLDYTRFSDTGKLIKFLQKFVNLKSLDLSGTHTTGFNLDELGDATLPFKLDTLNFEHQGYDLDVYRSNDSIIKTFIKCNVQCEDMNVNDRCDDTAVTTLTDFLLNQKSLKQLSIKFNRGGPRLNFVFRTLFDGGLEGLTKLSVNLKNVDNNEAQLENLLKFIGSQSETLKELELTIDDIVFPLISSHLLPMVQKTMKLEKLYMFGLTTGNVHLELKYENTTPLPNTHLKLLVLKNITIMSPDNLFRAFPSIEGLHLFMNEFYSIGIRASLILAASKHLKSLQSIQIPKLPVIPGDGSRMRIASLKSLHINYFEKNVIDNHAKFDEFLRYNPELEELIFDHVAVINNAFCETIMTMIIRNKLIKLKRVIVKKIVYGSKFFEEELVCGSAFANKHLTKVSESCPHLREFVINDCTESRSFHHGNIHIKLIASPVRRFFNKEIDADGKRRALKRKREYPWLEQCECSKRSFRKVCQFHPNLNDDY